MRLPNRPLLLPLACVILGIGCASSASTQSRTAATTAARVVPIYTDTASFRSAAQAMVSAFAAEVARARGGPLGTPPTVGIRNTTALIFFDDTANRIVAPWWDTTPPEMRAIFRIFAAGGDPEAEHLFRAFFNGFLLAHEAAHWFQYRANREEPTLYANENMANRLAVAFWRTQPGGEAFLVELERLAARAAANLPDPTPVGEDAVAYFGANYERLGPDPLKYGYYQFRFMRDAIRDRAQLDFGRMVALDGR